MGKISKLALSNQNKNLKIALIGYRLRGGGAEKVQANLSFFFERNGISVTHIIVLDELGYPFAGKVENLGKLKNNSNGVFNKLKRMFYLKQFLNKEQFDLLIDFRFRNKPFQEFFISKWIYKTPTIFTVHSYLIDHYIPKNRLLAQLIYAQKPIVAITQAAKKRIEVAHGFKNVHCIYNPIDVVEISKVYNESIPFDFDFIISMGQMETDIKQFDVLISAYAKSNLPQKNIHLVLLGEGKLQVNYKELAVKLGIEDKVHFVGYANNPFAYIRKALFYVLTSKNEGLPVSLLEALACETPLVAYDCLSGPNEIIVPNKNGVLVPNQDKNALIAAFNKMLNDVDFYQNCKQNCSNSLVSFEIENVGKQWVQLINQTL